MRAYGDQAGSVVLTSLPDRRFDRAKVVTVVDPRGVPAVRLEALGDVLRPGHRRRPVELDMVVVVEHDELAQSKVAGQRRDLRRDALLEVAVRRDDVGPVIDDLVAVAVELGAQPPLGDGHADGVGEALAERPGRRFDPRRQTRLGMSRRPRPPLPERAQLIERQVVARQVEQRVQQHRRVPGRQHEPVTVGPVRMRRRVAQEPRPQDVRHRGRAHRRPWMAGVRLLDAVDRQRPDRVDGEAVEVGRHGGHGQHSRCATAWGLSVGRPL